MLSSFLIGPSFLTLATIFGGVQGLIAVAPHLGGRIHWSPAFGVLGSIGALMVALIVGVPIKVIFCRYADPSILLSVAPLYESQCRGYTP